MKLHREGVIAALLLYGTLAAWLAFCEARCTPQEPVIDVPYEAAP